MNKHKAIFLLGGSDLEMQSIKELLEQEQVKYIDKQLTWGAKLSSYQKELEEFSSHTIYGIELIEDITPPKNYHKIDHHNELSANPSSLFQVLELLGKEPTREQELISANDVGHIEAMKCMGATKEEIAKIRQRDRQMQGVTAKEEAIALKELEQIEKEHGVYYLKTSFEHFSPIVDRFEKRPLLIYGKRGLTYYGDIEFLKENYREQIEKNQAYHGRGFFGFDSDYIQKVEVENLVEEIKALSQNNIYSYHQFMFPFRFDKIGERGFGDKHEFYRDNSFDDRVKIDEAFKISLEKDGWEYQKFEVKNHLDYNELVYFHDFVKDALFNTAEFKEGATSYFFEKKLKDNAKFELKVKEKNVYTLDLTGITLRLFDTGIGILSFELENRAYSDIEDVLIINDYGRRVYPQFLGDGFSTEPTKGSFLPEYVKVNGIEERVCDLYKEIKLAKYIQESLGKSFSTDKSQTNTHYLQPIIDDRMFVLCWYGNDALTSCTQESIENKNWYKYVFVDGKDLTVQDDEMHKELIEKATYRRWNKYGTFYGITRYSFVCLSNSDFPLPHMKSIYFQMITLLLIQRASLLRFSDEITAISDVRADNPSTEKIASLFKNYLRFVNKLYFKEVTAQDQGIELYDKAIEILNIKRDIEDLRQEIGTLNNYAFLEQEREEKEEINKLTLFGTYLLPPTIVAGFFGMNVFGKNSFDIENTSWFWGVSILVFASAFIIPSYLWIKNKIIKEKKSE